MFHTALVSAYASILQEKYKEKQEADFIKSISNLSPDRQAELKEKRRLEQREERMHAELCDAIRDSKSNVNVRVSRY